MTVMVEAERQRNQPTWQLLRVPERDAADAASHAVLADARRPVVFIGSRRRGASAPTAASSAMSLEMIGNMVFGLPWSMSMGVRFSLASSLFGHKFCCLAQANF
jgi:hypothetical protein